jgi:hypothetical protein
MLTFIILYLIIGQLVMKLIRDDELEQIIMSVNNPILCLLVYLLLSMVAPIYLIYGIIQGLRMYFNRRRKEN